MDLREVNQDSKEICYIILWILILGEASSRTFKLPLRNTGHVKNNVSELTSRAVNPCIGNKTTKSKNFVS